MPGSLLLGGGDPELGSAFRANGVPGLEAIAATVDLDLSPFDAVAREIVVAFVAMAFEKGEGVAWAVRRVELATGMDYGAVYPLVHTLTGWTLNARSLERYAASPLPIREIEWLEHRDACDLCQRNARSGAVALGSVFPSGHVMPPAHAGCRCSTLPVLPS